MRSARSVLINWARPQSFLRGNNTCIAIFFKVQSDLMTEVHKMSVCHQDKVSTAFNVIDVDANNPRETWNPE